MAAAEKKAPQGEAGPQGAGSPADAKWREISARPRDRRYLDMLDRLAFACPLHAERPDDAESESYEGEVERCKGLVRRPSERECMEALKRLVAECGGFDPVAKGCRDGWRGDVEAEEHCWAPFRAALADAEALLRDAMACEVCGAHPEDELGEWGCYVCGIECCAKCKHRHVCAEEKHDARDIELAREARRR